MTRDAVAVVIPARNEEARIAATVAAASTLHGVELVIVVSDGSTDATVERAWSAGAIVLRHPHPRGKAAALVTGTDAVSLIEQYEHRAVPRHLLLLDADLEGSAGAAQALIDPVVLGVADLTIARFPRSAVPGAGRGLVVGLAERSIRRRTGWAPTQPLSGQRCLTRAAFDAARPLAHGFGVETGMTIDVLAAGFVVREVDTSLSHRVTGADLRSQLHRARQLVDVGRAVAVRESPSGLVAAQRRLRRHVTGPVASPA